MTAASSPERASIAERALVAGPPQVLRGGKCGAKKRKGEGTCGRPAGWGTDHLGYGRCKFHTGSTPRGKAAAAREAGQHLLRVMGDPLDVGPLDALLETVRTAAGHLAFARMMTGDLDSDVTSALNEWVIFEQQAVDRLARVSKMAVDAGVAERQVRIAERQGEAIAAAAERAIAQMGEALTPALRARFVKAFASELALLESAPLEGEAHEA